MTDAMVFGTVGVALGAPLAWVFWRMTPERKVAGALLLAVIICSFWACRAARAEDLTARLKALEAGAEPVRGTVTRMPAGATVGTGVTCYRWVAGCEGFSEYSAAERERMGERVKAEARAEAEADAEEARAWAPPPVVTVTPADGHYGHGHGYRYHHPDGRLIGVYVGR